MKDTNKDFLTLFKQVIIGLFVVLIIFLLFRNCKCGKSGGTTVKIDTVYVEVKGDVTYVPLFDTIFYTKTKYVPTNPDLIIDTLYLPELIDVDTLAILKDYYASVVYKDTLRNQYGYISVTDTLSQNRIKSRQVKTSLLVPEVTTTITLTQPKRAQVYLGASILGNEDDILQGAEINLSLKTRKDRIIEAAYIRTFDNIHFYKFGYKHKISFKK